MVKKRKKEKMKQTLKKRQKQKFLMKCFLFLLSLFTSGHLRERTSHSRQARLVQLTSLIDMFKHFTREQTPHTRTHAYQKNGPRGVITCRRNSLKNVQKWNNTFPSTTKDWPVSVTASLVLFCFCFFVCLMSEASWLKKKQRPTVTSAGPTRYMRHPHLGCLERLTSASAREDRCLTQQTMK